MVFGINLYSIGYNCELFIKRINLVSVFDTSEIQYMEIKKRKKLFMFLKSFNI
jgi:hypothetical protein